MKNLLIIIFLSCICNTLLAQNNSAEKSIKDISSDLASINQQLLEIYQSQQATTQTVTIRSEKNIPTAEYNVKTSFSKKEREQKMDPFNIMFEKIIKEIRDIKIKYEDNPYVSIKGFDINIGIPPSVTVALEFKK